MGPGRLELPTSRLSGVRSNQAELRAPWKIISITGLASGHYILESPNKPTDCSVLSFQLKGYEDGASSADLEFGLRVEEEYSPTSLKGGDPAAGSPTATLLRLHPSR